MKSLTQYIAESKALHQNVNIDKNVSSVSLEEGLRLSIDDSPYQYHPTTCDELRELVRERYKELGPGTEQNPIDFNDIDVSKLKTLVSDNNIGVFENIKFKYIDVSSWNVSNVEDMHNLFRSTILRSVEDLSNWDVSRVKDMHSMFYECFKLESIGDISNWNVSSVENMNCMFTHCEKLESIGDLSNWDISNVSDIKWIFVGCIKLKSVGDLSNWDISNGKDTKYIFRNSGITNKPKWYKE